MALQELDNQQSEAPEPCVGPLAAISSLDSVTRRRRSKSSVSWRNTVTQHVPETWPAARLALQARIAALDIED